MTASPAILCTFDGESFVPKTPRIAERYYTAGQVYSMAQQEHRSRETHNHFFAALEEGWRNLPEDTAERFPTSEHLRKYCLIKAGFYDERSIVCSSKAEAQRVAGFIKPMDEFAIVVVREAAIRVFTAKSQSQRAMGRKLFQESKQSVLDIIAGMVGVTPAELAHEAGKAA